MVTGRRIRVLVVDDSIMFRTAISKALEQDPQIEVVGSAFSAHSARDKILELQPDVMTLDVEMPGMNGIEFLKLLIPQHPMPIIVVSAANGIVFEALQAGAVDFIAKPEAGDIENFSRELASKIKIASIARLVRRVRSEASAANKEAAPVPLPLQIPTGGGEKSMLVAIGASTGGTEATSQILKVLPREMPGIVITQHMPPVFTRMYAERLNRESLLTVSEAKDGVFIQRGHVYVAPGDAHLQVARRGSELVLKVGGTEKVSGHCPSVDVMFRSVGDVMGARAVGILLTGMGADGAKGLFRMKETGAFTIGQDQQSSVVYGMPMEALKLGAVTRQASLEMIPSVLLNQLKINSRL
ncbi:MAG: chemotaxis response regulator protein-glutamate methylesterase [Clostridia bacterium]|nr:chemotaxis response regulator protein-glutamate methylesterase [Clostridia bacterium]